MAVNSKIGWTDYTWNPWRGCAKVSPGCTHCYAETLSQRNPAVLGTWGKDAPRAMAAESYMRLPFAWDKLAAAAGERKRVFPSLMDPFEDREDLMPQFLRLLDAIRRTPNLDWLILTKRIEGAHDMLRRAMEEALRQAGLSPSLDQAELIGWLHDWASFGRPPRNAWLGATVETAEYLWRVDKLREVPAAMRFLSLEPQLAYIDLRGRLEGIGWVIVGGESGDGAREFELEWAYDSRDVCRDEGVAYYFKQTGKVARRYGQHYELRFDKKMGKDPDDWPLELRVREFPIAPALAVTR